MELVTCYLALDRFATEFATFFKLHTTSISIEMLTNCYPLKPRLGALPTAIISPAIAIYDTMAACLPDREVGGQPHAPKSRWNTHEKQRKMGYAGWHARPQPGVNRAAQKGVQKEVQKEVQKKVQKEVQKRVQREVQRRVQKRVQKEDKTGCKTGYKTRYKTVYYGGLGKMCLILYPVLYPVLFLTLSPFCPPFCSPFCPPFCAAFCTSYCSSFCSYFCAISMHYLFDFYAYLMPFRPNSPSYLSVLWRGGAAP